jgi:hypothetical protein
MGEGGLGSNVGDTGLNKTFTLSEAQTLLPLVEALVRRAQSAGIRAAEMDSEMQELNRRIFVTGGMRVDVAVASRRRATRDKSVQEAKDTLAELEAIGVQIKDLELGLLDFPCVMDGQSVLLCWKLGEKEIGFWHSEEDGYEGRKPLDGRFGKSERERLN